VGSPLPMGRGFVKARHGILPLPPPAALECLRGVPTYGVDLDAELVTPTGAAIVATVASRFERCPTFAPERIGFGAGTREMAAHAIEALFTAGALDAWAIPITMKKGRPALTIAALAAAESADRVAFAMMAETTTIGVRRVPVSRTERPRRIVSVTTPFGAIR